MDSNERALMVALATDFSFCLLCPALVMYSCPSVRRNFRLLFKLNSKSLSPVSSDSHRIQSTKNPKVGLEFNIKGCVLLYSDFLKIATLEDTFPNIIQEDKDEHQEFINQIIQGYEWLLWIPKYMWVKRGRKSILKQETAKNYLDIKYSILGNYVHLKF